MKTGSMFLTLFFGVFYVIGFVMLGYGLWSLWRATQAASWPTTLGKVTECTLKSHHDEDGMTYSVDVKYVYSVNGKEYAGDRVAFGYAGTNDHGMHQTVHDRLKNAASVDVRYNPDNPSTSALSHGIHQSIKDILTFSVVWLGFIIGVSILARTAGQPDTVVLENLSVH